MSAITERPLRDRVLFESLSPQGNPFILGSSWLGRQEPAFTWGFPLGTGAETIAWQQFRDQLLSVNITRGGIRDGITVRNDVGLCTVALRDFEIDPDNPAFGIDQSVRFTAFVGGVKVPRFTGRVRDISTDWIDLAGTGKRVPVTTITSVDAVSILDEITAPGFIMPGGGTGFRARIAALSRLTDVPFNLPTDADYPSPLGGFYALAPCVYDASLSTHLTLACNSVGAMWWIDGAGVVQFQRRQHAGDVAVFVASDNRNAGPDVLQMIKPTMGAGVDSQVNAAILRNRGATYDAENGWQGTETDHYGIDWERPGRLVSVLETNNPSNEWPYDVHFWLQPYRASPTNVLTGLRWNAQQMFHRLPEIEIGTSIRTSMGGTYRGPWPDYIVIGTQETITPTRWMVNLTLIGATT